MPWSLYLALKQLFPTGKKVSFFAVLSIGGVSLGVCLLVVVLTVMNGFQTEIRAKIVDTSGDIRVESSSIIYDYDGLMETILDTEYKGEKVIDSISPYAYGFVMVQNRNVPVFPAVRGIDVNLESSVTPFEKFLKSGSIDDLDDDSVFVSSGLARKIGAYKGDVIEVVSPLIIEKLNQDEIMLPRELTVVGIFETGWTVIDNNTMFCTLPTMQDFYGMADGIHGISVKLIKGYEDDVDLVVNQMNENLNANEELPWGIQAFSWLDLNRDFLFVLQLEKGVMFFLLLFVVLVAAFAITSTLLSSVVRKTREIGLLGALGATRRGLLVCYAFQGLVIGIVGTILGLCFAALAIHYRNGIVGSVASIFNKEETLVRFYQFTHLPAHYLVSDLIVISASTIIFSLLAGMIPAFRAASFDPATALRNE